MYYKWLSVGRIGNPSTKNSGPCIKLKLGEPACYVPSAGNDLSGNFAQEIGNSYRGLVSRTVP